MRPAAMMTRVFPLREEPANRIRVAVVEDNNDLREGLAQLLGVSPGLSCAGAFANCDQFFRRLPGISPDVVLMDIGLPGMSGIEGVRMLKSKFPVIDVLMLTVFDDEQRIFESVCAGASGYLLKKTPPRGIIEAIHEIRNGGAPMTATVARKVLEMFQKSAPPTGEDSQLTGRELEVLEELVKGMSYKMIADSCCVSVDTVRSRIKKIYEKLHVHSKSEAVVKALRSRLV